MSLAKAQEGRLDEGDYSFPSTNEHYQMLGEMVDFTVEKLIQIRRNDKKAIGYKIVFKTGQTASYGKLVGDGYSECVFDRQPRWIEVSNLQKADGKPFVKITYADEDSKPIDCCLFYTSGYPDDWPGKKVYIKEEHQIIGFDITLESDKQTIKYISPKTWIPPKLTEPTPTSQVKF